MQYILPIVAIEALGDYHLAQYAMNKSIHGLVVGYASYAALLVFFIISIRKMGLAWSNASWGGWSALATGFVAVVFLKEKPTTREIFGIIFIIIGLLLLGADGTRAH
jgi:multidrug transporter EmrE-like cation transporter